MAGLDPAICAAIAFRLLDPDHQSMRGGWVYIVTNRPNGALYIGVTANLARRASEHRIGVIPGFSRRYGLKRLVYAEHHQDIRSAIPREKNLKHWSRAWKIHLIVSQNPEWDDRFGRIA